MIHIFRDTTQIQYWISTALSSNTKQTSKSCRIFYPCNVGTRLSLLVVRSARSSRGNFTITSLISTSSRRWIIPVSLVILTFLFHRFFTIMIIHMLPVNLLIVKEENKKIIFTCNSSRFPHSAADGSAPLPRSPSRSAGQGRRRCRI